MANPSRATAAAVSETAVRPSPSRCPFHLSPEPLREAPAPEPLQGSLDDPSHPDASREPVLNVANIQGNILVGFNKDHQAFLFLSLATEDFEDEAFREGLAARSTAGILGDPSREDQTDAEGHPDNWVLGGTQEVIDVVVLVASDDESELDASAPGSLEFIP